MPDARDRHPAFSASNSPPPAGGEAAIVFGPVPSRRLGLSLGISSLPHKTCSYACVYCQAGRTTRLSVRREPFVPPGHIAQAVDQRLRMASRKATRVDVLTFVPQGEATLDCNLEATILGLRTSGCPIAVITNTSMICDTEVRRALALAEVVSLKVDAVDEAIWHTVNRPHRSLSLPRILQDALAFARSFSGRLLTETMLVSGLNDGEDHLQALAKYLMLLNPEVAYLSAPIRPPAEPWVRPPTDHRLLRAHQILAAQVSRVEYLLGDEGTDFFAGDDPVQSLLAVTGVHPMRRAAALQMLHSAGSPGAVLDRLVADGHLTETQHQGQTFYLRALPPAEGRSLNLGTRRTSAPQC